MMPDAHQEAKGSETIAGIEGRGPRSRIPAALPKETPQLQVVSVKDLRGHVAIEDRLRIAVHGRSDHHLIQLRKLLQINALRVQPGPRRTGRQDNLPIGPQSYKLEIGIELLLSILSLKSTELLRSSFQKAAFQR